MTEFIQFTI